jgi:hypothetical protein
MGERFNNIKNLFNDARTRTIFIITTVVLLFAVGVGYYFFSSIIGPQAITAVEGAPSIESVPGSEHPSPEYAGLVNKKNLEKAQQAEKSGSSAIPTIIRTSSPEQAEELPIACETPSQYAGGQDFEIGLERRPVIEQTEQTSSKRKMAEQGEQIET